MLKKIFGESKFTFKDDVIDWETVKKHKASQIVIFRSIPNKNKSRKNDKKNNKKPAQLQRNSYYLLTELRTRDVLKNQHACPRKANDRVQLSTVDDLNKKQLSLFIDPDGESQLKEVDELEMIERNEESLDILNSIPWTPPINLSNNGRKSTEYNDLAVDTMTTIRENIKNKNFEMLGGGQHYVNKDRGHDQYVPRGINYTLEQFDELSKKAPNITSDDIDKTYKKLHHRLAPKCQPTWKRYKSTAKAYKTIIKEVSTITSPQAIWQSQQQNKKIDLSSPTPTSTPEPVTPRSHTPL